MLTRMTSRDVAEWRAFEIVNGPVDSGWRDDVLAAIHEQLQQISHLTGAAHFTDEDNDNPVPTPERYPRPGRPEEPVEEEESWLL